MSFVAETPEFQLLVLCCLPQGTPEQEAEIGRLAEATDWPRFEWLAKRHNVQALAFARFEEDRRAMPDEVWHRLREEYLLNARHNLMLSAELLRLRDLFAKNNLTFLPYKGPALAASVYGNIVLRRSLDLDLLIRPNELLPSVEALNRNGYPLLDDWLSRVPNEVLKFRGEYKIRKGDILLELQWRPAPRYYGVEFDAEAMAKRAKPGALAGELIPMLSPEDHLLLLCAHGWKETWGRLTWVGDVAHLLATYPDLDWKYLIEAARGANSVRLTLVGLNLSAEVFGSALPKRIDEAVAADPRVAALTQHLIRRLQSDDDSREATAQLVEYRERWIDRVRFRYGLLFHPTESEWATTGSGSEFVHRAARLRRVFSKFLT